MRLWTIQTRELFDTLMRQEYVYCDRIGYYNENNPEAYQWMCEQMRQRIGEPPLPEIKYPLWAYYQYNCRKDRQPKYELGSEEKEGVYMEIDLPESDVLLSDLSSWTFAALNGWHWGKNKRLERRIDALRAEAGGYIAFEDYPEDIKEDIKASWVSFFDPMPPVSGYMQTMRRNRCIQGTFWMLRKEQVVSVELMVRHKGNNVKITRLL